MIINLDVEKAVKAIEEMLTISEEEKLANDWSHKVIARLFALLTNSQARDSYSWIYRSEQTKIH